MTIHTTTRHTARATASQPTLRANRRRAGRRATAILAPMSLLFAAGCGADPAAQDAPAPLVRAVTASAADAEGLAVDAAEQGQVAMSEKVYGSDRHFGVIADQVAEARIRATEGSDRHFGVIKDGLVDARIRAAEGSDRHLVLLAEELAARAERA